MAKKKASKKASKKVSKQKSVKSPKAVEKKNVRGDDEIPEHVLEELAEVDDLVESEDQRMSVTQSQSQAIEVTVGGVPKVVTIKTDINTNKDWESTVADADLGELVPTPYDGFSAVQDMDTPSHAGGVTGTYLQHGSGEGQKLNEGDILQVQFPNGNIIELQVHLSPDGMAHHRSWWAGVAVMVPLNGLYARQVTF